MVIKTKQITYKQEDIDLARFSRALSHPARIAILNHLNREGSCNCKTLVQLLPLAQATVSQHLKELLDSGMIQVRQSPPRTIYCIDRKNWKTARQMISGLMEMGWKSPER